MHKRYKGFTLLELLIVVVILGILVLIASTVLLNAAHKAKNAAVQANMSAAASTMLTSLTVAEKTPEEAINENLSILNDPDSIADSKDEIHSPYDQTIDGFVDGEEGDRGQVALAAGDDYVIIRGFGAYGSAEDPISVKTVRPLSEEESGS